MKFKVILVDMNSKNYFLKTKVSNLENKTNHIKILEILKNKNIFVMKNNLLNI